MGTSRRSSGPVVQTASLYSGAGNLRGGASCFTSAFASSSSSSSFSSRFPSTSSSIFDHHNHHHHRSASPTRVHLVGASPPRRSPSVRFSLDRPTSPGRSLPAVVNNKLPAFGAAVTRSSARRTCMCSPTTHPGSFRCSLHKGLNHHPHHHHHSNAAASSPSNRLNARRSAMANSLVRIGTVEGEWVKRALAALIRPSSHQQRRRGDFQPRPSRLSVMSRAEDPS